MRIESKLENDRSVLYLHGKVTIGVGDVKLRNAIHELVDQGARDIVIDLENVTTIDSAGIGELVAACTTVEGQGGVLQLRNLPSGVDFPDFPSFPDGFAY